MPLQFTYAHANRGNSVRIDSPTPSVCVGNLVKNGGFEEGLAHWIATNVQIVGGKEPHAGWHAAGLGAFRKNRRLSTLQQDVRIALETPQQFYQIIFHVAGYKDAPAELLFTAIWLNDDRAQLGIGAEARIQRRAIGNGSRGKWTTYNLVTNEAPLAASFLRLHFLKQPGRKPYRFVILDDVVLIRVPPLCRIDA